MAIAARTPLLDEIVAIGLVLAGVVALLLALGFGRRWAAAMAAPGGHDHETMARRLAAGVAHEVNNTLTVLALNAEMVGSADPDDASLGLIRRSMLDVTQRCTLLTQRLLAYAQRTVLRPRLVDLAGELRGRQAALAGALHRGQSLVCVGLDRGDVPATIDPDGLADCLIALLANAADAAGPHAEICLELQCIPGTRGGAVLLTVVDTGAGMDRATLRQALEPGFSAKAGGRHLGLGLAAAAGFARQSGGRLVLDSKSGLGTRASIVLPRYGGPAPTVATGNAVVIPKVSLPRPISADPTSGNQPIVRVLLVDDNEAVCESIARHLRLDGYDVIEAHTAAAAYAIVAEGVDVLITDIVLDDANDGFALAVRAREAIPTLPLVFMSGYMSSRQPALLAGDELASFLRKPINGAELRTVLAGLIAARDSGRVKAS